MTSRVRVFSALLLLGLLAPTPRPSLAQESFTANVIDVIDGDTLRVARTDQELTLRLFGVDCPGTNQAHGQTAREFTRQKIMGQTVQIRVWDRDGEGRLIAEVRTTDGQNLGELLVRNGHAWWYHWTAAEQRPLALLEIEARSKRLGLWADPHPIPPWTFEALPKRQSPGLASSSGASASAGSNDPPRPLAENSTVYSTEGGDRYHRDGCRALLSKKFRLTVKKARAQGLSPCPVCRP